MPLDALHVRPMLLTINRHKLPIKNGVWIDICQTCLVTESCLSGQNINNRVTTDMGNGVHQNHRKVPYGVMHKME